MVVEVRTKDLGFQIPEERVKASIRFLHLRPEVAWVSPAGGLDIDHVWTPVHVDMGPLEGVPA